MYTKKMPFKVLDKDYFLETEALDARRYKNTNDRVSSYLPLDFLSWFEAQQSCIRRGGDLVSFNTMEELQAVIDVIYAADHPIVYTYIGLKKENQV